MTKTETADARRERDARAVKALREQLVSAERGAVKVSEVMRIVRTSDALGAKRGNGARMRRLLKTAFPGVKGPVTRSIWGVQDRWYIGIKARSGGVQLYAPQPRRAGSYGWQRMGRS